MKKTIITKGIKTYTLIQLVVVAVVAFQSLAFTFSQVSNRAAAAGSASFSITPSSQSFITNDTVTTTVSVNTSGEVVDSAWAKLTYDASKLQYTGMTEFTAPLDVGIKSDVTSGSIQIARATFGAGSATPFNFVRITFKAIATGNSTVKVNAGSQIIKAGTTTDIWNGIQTTANYTTNNPPVVTPPPTTPPVTTTPPTNNPTTPPSTNPTQPLTPVTNTPTSPSQPVDNSTPIVQPQAPEPTPDIIAEQPKIKTNKLRKLTVELGTKQQVFVKLAYGIEGETFITTPEEQVTGNVAFDLDQTTIIPGKTYTYKVIITKDDGTIFETPLSTFRAKGYSTKIILRDNNGKPLKQIKAVLRSEPREGTTNDEGELILDDVEAGNHTLYFAYAGKDVEQPITIAANEVQNPNTGDLDTPVQVIEINLNDTSRSLILPILLGGVLGALLLGAGFFIYKTKIKQDRFYSQIPDQQQAVSSPAVTTEKDRYLQPAPIVPQVITPTDDTNISNETPKSS